VLEDQQHFLEVLEEQHRFFILVLRVPVSILQQKEMEVATFRLFHLRVVLQFHPSHPTSSPVSLGPSTPVLSASTPPVGLLSSPGRMFDVGGTLNPPGLPLSGPPRVAGSYGISMNDPVFGMYSGCIPCNHPGQVPMPAQSPVAPPPPPQGVGGQFSQLLVGHPNNGMMRLVPQCSKMVHTHSVHADQYGPQHQPCQGREDPHLQVQSPQ